MDTEIIKYDGNSMSSLEVAKALNVTVKTVLKYAGIVCPNAIKNGVKTLFNESDVTLIKLELDKNQHLEQSVKLPKTNLEKELIIQQAMNFQAEKISTLQSENEKLQIELKEAEPKIEFHDQLEASKDAIPVVEFANILAKRGVEIGQNRLFKFFYDHEYLIDKIRPYQKCLDNKWMEVNEYTYFNYNGDEKIARRVLITGKGQTYFAGKIKDSFPFNPVQSSF